MRILPILALLGAMLGGCSSSPCERLTDELCTARGEEDALCQARRSGSDDRSRFGDLQCKRALFLYQTESGGGE